MPNGSKDREFDGNRGNPRRGERTNRRSLISSGRWWDFPISPVMLDCGNDEVGFEPAYPPRAGGDQQIMASRPGEQ